MSKMTFIERLKTAWRVVFPLSQKQQEKRFKKAQAKAFMEKTLVNHIVDFYVGSVAYNLYSEASAGNLNTGFFHDMLSQTIMISGLQGAMKDIIVTQVREAIDEGYLQLEDEDDLSTFNAIPIDLTEKGKTYVIDAVKDGMTNHFQKVIDQIDAVVIEMEEEEA